MGVGVGVGVGVEVEVGVKYVGRTPQRSHAHSHLPSHIISISRGTVQLAASAGRWREVALKKPFCKVKVKSQSERQRGCQRGRKYCEAAPSMVCWDYVVHRDRLRGSFLHGMLGSCRPK